MARERESRESVLSAHLDNNDDIIQYKNILTHCLSLSISLPFSLSLSLYIYIYRRFVYRDNERMVHHCANQQVISSFLVPIFSSFFPFWTLRFNSPVPNKLSSDDCIQVDNFFSKVTVIIRGEILISSYNTYIHIDIWGLSTLLLA